MAYTTEEALASAKERLEKHNREHDSEEYHVTFDEILEDRLAELDPEFMNRMKQMYENSNQSRWYA